MYVKSLPKMTSKSATRGLTFPFPFLQSKWQVLWWFLKWSQNTKQKSPMPAKKGDLIEFIAKRDFTGHTWAKLGNHEKLEGLLCVIITHITLPCHLWFITPTAIAAGTIEITVTRLWRAVIMFNWNDFCERRKPSFNRIISLSRNRRPFPIVFCQLKKK